MVGRLVRLATYHQQKGATELAELSSERPNFFESGSPYLQHPLLTQERTEAEVDFVVEQLKLTPDARIVDVGCGFGRHSIELARRGYSATGIDPSPAMIGAAQRGASEAGVAVDFRIANGETFAPDQQFDAAICLFTTVGQISATGENSALLGNVYVMLRVGACLLVELPQREAALAALKEHDRFGDDERYTEVHRSFDRASKTVTERFELVYGRESRAYLLRYYLYGRDEFEGLLKTHGFSVRAAFGGYDGSALSSANQTMIFLAQR